MLYEVWRGSREKAPRVSPAPCDTTTPAELQRTVDDVVEGLRRIHAGSRWVQPVFKMSQEHTGGRWYTNRAMRRVVIAVFGVGLALAALAHCGGTTGRDDSTPSGPDGGLDATVDAAAVEDAGSDQSVYTNTFDVSIQYADQALPDVQAPPEGGGAGSEAGLGVPNCPPFLWVDGYGKPVACDPASPISDCPSADNEAPADWSDGGEVLARDGSVCATYPWLGTAANDECLTGDLQGELVNDLPPCNWALEAGVATQGPAEGTSRYALCVQLYKCFMQTRCFAYPKPNGKGLESNPIPCFCLTPAEATSGSFSVSTCLAAQGPCFNEEIAALEAPGNDPGAQATYVQMNFIALGNSQVVAGTEGANLNQMFQDALSTGCIPECVLDAGVDCGP